MIIKTIRELAHTACRICKFETHSNYIERKCNFCKKALWPYLCHEHKFVKLVCNMCSHRYIKLFPNASITEEIVFYYNPNNKY